MTMNRTRLCHGRSMPNYWPNIRNFPHHLAADTAAKRRLRCHPVHNTLVQRLAGQKTHVGEIQQAVSQLLTQSQRLTGQKMCVGEMISRKWSPSASRSRLPSGSWCRKHMSGKILQGVTQLLTVTVA